MPTGRIVLFSLETGGHHIEYVSYLTRYLLERDYEVMFVALKEVGDFSLLPRHDSRLKVECLTGDPGARMKADPIALSAQLWKGLTRCYRLATDWGADAVCVMCLDYAELPLLLRTLAWRRRGWRLFAFLAWPYSVRGRSDRAVLHKRFYRRLRRWGTRTLLKRGLLSGVFVHTRLGKASIIGNSRQQGQFQERVLNVPEPCPQFDSTCSAAEARRHLSLPQDKCVLLFFGRLRWDKGIDILIEALQSLEEDFALVVAGQEGHMTLQQLEEARMRLPGTWELIAHIRHIDSEDVKYYFIAADAVLLPYRRAFRGTSGVLRNAAAAGKPVIASDVGEMGDIVRQYSLGLVVEPESQEALRDAIKFFVRERSKIAPHVREYALAYAEAHHWRRMAELVEEAFRGCSRARQNLEEAGGGAEMPAPWEQRRCARRS